MKISQSIYETYHCPHVQKQLIIFLNYAHYKICSYKISKNLFKLTKLFVEQFFKYYKNITKMIYKYILIFLILSFIVNKIF